MKNIFTLLLCLFSVAAIGQISKVWKMEEAKNTNKPEEVIYLSLKYRQLTKIPDWVYRFKNLQKLDLSGNDIRIIPRKLNLLKKLTEINLSENGTEAYRQEVFAKTMAFRKKTGAAVDELVKQKTFFDLNAQQQRDKLDSLRATFREAREAFISSMPSPIPTEVKFEKCRYIKKIKMKDCFLKKVPSTLHCLVNLETIILDKNKIEKISNKLTRLKKLVSLSFNYNKINSINHLRFRKLSKLDKLFLGRNQLSQIPDDIEQLAQLTKLNLAGNKLKQVSPAIQKLTQLKHLILYDNSIEKIPGFIFDMRDLVELDLAYNKINEVSPKIGQLTQLQDLYLSYNQLSNLPASIGDMSSLRKMYLHHNKLYDLPKTIAKLNNISVLHLNNNRFMAIPAEIYGLQKMVDLNLAFNQLEEFDLRLSKFPKLKLLFINSNNIKKGQPEYASYRKMFDAMRAKNIVVND